MHETTSAHVQLCGTQFTETFSGSFAKLLRQILSDCLFWDNFGASRGERYCGFFLCSWDWVGK